MRRAIAALLLLTAACNDDANLAAVPPPVAMTETALGYFCQMDVLNHDGPKGQIHLSGFPAPLWFSQVRDGIAYIKSAERSAEVTAFYVNDMAVATNWSDPGPSNWVNAQDAYFVIGSDAIGGMGAPELVPFRRAGDAEAFAARRGGVVKTLSEISAETVLSPVDIAHQALGTAS